MLAAGRLSGLLPLAGVAGHPIAHSLSPAMMTAWLEASGPAGRYVAFDIAPERFEAAVRALPALGISGLNVTVPHKEAALSVADRVSVTARAIGAANLLLAREDGLHADNTDAAGVGAALAAAGGIADGPAVLLGAGGAARAALHVLKPSGRTLRIVNRSTERARRLAKEFDVEAQIHDWASASEALDDAVLVINATSLGMTGKPALEIDLASARPDAVVFDMVYAPLETALLKRARETGRRPVDGLEMLIGQARPSFEAFFGAPPPQDVPIKAILTGLLEARS